MDEKITMDDFIAIPWPDVQQYMDNEDFFDNASLINSFPFTDEYGNSAYFVRKLWLKGL